MYAEHAMRGFAAGAHPGCGCGWRAMTGRRGRGGPGRFGWGPGGFGFAGAAMRGPRVRRGNVRAGILALLDEEPRNGYQIIQELTERSGGVWRPSPGSVYPALQQLEDEGLVRVEEVEGRRAYRLTDEGRSYVDARREELKAPWDAVSDTVADDVLELRDLAWQLGAAVMQAAHAGSEADIAEAKRILADARKAIYRLLAGDEPAEG